MASKTLTNSAHEPGYTCITFSRDGKLSYTGGSDSLVRIWNMEKDQYQEPEVAYEADEGITSIASSNDYWLSGSQDSEVRSYIHGKPDLHGLVLKAAGVSIRDLAFDPAGKRVAIATDETTVKVVDINDITNVILLDGHKKCIRKVTWHPSGNLLTTSSADGIVTVWDISGSEPRIEKTIDGVIPAVSDPESPEFMHDCSAVWHPSGLHLYISSRAHDVVVISRPNWEKLASFSDSSITGAITALALSVNGLYLASACKEEIVVWSTQTRRVLWRQSGTPKAIITQLAFSPSQNLLAWTDNEGILTWWREPVPAGSPDPVKQSTAANIQGGSTKHKVPPTLWGADDDIDNSGVDNKGIGAGGNDDGNQYGDDWIIDDLGDGMEDEAEETGQVEAGNKFVKEMVSITKAQPPFQPSSTPMENKRRYLAYNTVGVIEVADQDTHHITTSRERGALFACPPEQEHPAQVRYKPYGTWSAQGDWEYTLPPGQRVLGLAAGGEKPTKSLRDPSTSGGDIQGQGNVVVATSAGDLTFLSGSGMERIVLGLEGEFVSIAAAEEYVIVVHRPGATTIDGSQGLTATLISFGEFEVLQQKPLPIPKGHVLKWIGITDEGVPAIYDSSGHMHIMINFRRPNRASWARILDANALERKQNRDESYWPVGLSKDTLMCIILKGRQEHPGFPRPLIQEVPLRMPFRNKDSVDAPIEESTARERIFINLARDGLEDELTNPELDKREIELDKSLIKLIQSACKSDKAPRAIELTKRLHFAHSIGAASQLAGFYRLLGLQEKIDAIKQWREEQGGTPLERAREKRRELEEEDRYMKAPKKPFQDFEPPKKIERPALARPAAVVEHTEFTASNATARAVRTRVEAQEHGWTPPPEGKRKRDTEDEVGFKDLEREHNKRCAVGETSTPIPSPRKENPFARKNGFDTKRNPFARKPEFDKPIQKSESFFNKVEAVEFNDKGKRPANGKGKEKEKKDLSRQTTLFGLPPKQIAESKSKNTTGKIPGTESQGSSSIGESQTQTTDVDMTEASSVSKSLTFEDGTLVQPHEDGNVVETQPIEEDEEGEPIDWPDSPQTSGVELAMDNI
ncbi:hypothetical protein F5J12DRAFT_946238 [Pisolithus orientalis]|uniref:uncharacterized protein n=1 Tax=Pisolithus orientalis TaxID=936130 RepID=UPI0022245282|nr:uncharacterized protein F5J12DRAFT_946238 [Pisolithus orientalis]KAI6033002.1 hypothetical protein F5J12DRAFT_946238 [Pisolithus orientalis]